MERYTIIPIEPAMTKMIRKYFKEGHSIVISAGLLIFGGWITFKGLFSYYIGGTYVMLLGMFIAGVGISWLLEDNYKGEKEADEAKIKIVRALRSRGLNKLNLVKEQVAIIKPIMLLGCGAKPSQSFQDAKLRALHKMGMTKYFITWFKVLMKKQEKEYDPKEAYMIGSDELLRSLLIEVSIYYMTEEEILLYIVDVDISTGMIYKEATSECFYQDIEAVRFDQMIHKVFHIKQKKYVNRMSESFGLYMGGSSFGSSIDPRYKNTELDHKFMALRNLIREKKNILN